jgi:hypothetical protein
VTAADRDDEIDDAAPPEVVKWSFVRRCMSAVFGAHGYREVAASPLELRGTHLLAHASPAWPVGDDLELRADPLVSLAQLFARTRREARASGPTLTRWLLADVVFDPAALRPEPEKTHRYPAWEAVTGAVFGVAEHTAELELALVAQRAMTVLALSEPRLEATFADPTSATRLRTGLADLQVPFTEAKGGRPGLCVTARTEAGERLVIARAARKDGLLAALGESPAPLVGLTLSVRHAASCIPGAAESYETMAQVFFVVDGPGARAPALAAAARERARGLRIDVELRDVGLDVQYARARACNARVIVEFGAALGLISVRRADEAQGRTVAPDELGHALRRMLR